MKTWKASADPDYAAKKARVDHLYALADGEAAPGPGDPQVVVCVDLCRHRDYAEVSVVGSHWRDDAGIPCHLAGAGVGIVAG